MKKSKLGPVLLLIVVTTAIAQVYRWVDEEGGIHFGDNPPEEVDAEKLIFESRHESIAAKRCRVLKN